MANTTSKNGDTLVEPKDADKADVVGVDTEGKITNTPNGAGTKQQEPKVDDYPLSARITPPLQQVNPAAASSVGAVVNDGKGNDASIEDAAEAHSKNVADGQKAAAKVADLRREMNEASPDASVA